VIRQVHGLGVPTVLARSRAAPTTRTRACSSPSERDGLRRRHHRGATASSTQRLRRLLRTHYDCTPGSQPCGRRRRLTGFAFLVPQLRGRRHAGSLGDGTVAPVHDVTPGCSVARVREPYLAISVAFPDEGTVRVLNLRTARAASFRVRTPTGQPARAAPGGALALGPGYDVDRSETGPPGAYGWAPGASPPRT
jgi:hypothetical protein